MLLIASIIILSFGQKRVTSGSSLYTSALDHIVSDSSGIKFFLKSEFQDYFKFSRFHIYMPSDTLSDITFEYFDRDWDSTFYDTIIKYQGIPTYINKLEVPPIANKLKRKCLLVYFSPMYGNYFIVDLIPNKKRDDLSYNSSVRFTKLCRLIFYNDKSNIRLVRKQIIIYN